MIDHLPPAMIEFLIKKGAMQPTKQDLPLNKFPINKKNRSFQTSWYWQLLPGNIHVQKDWLSYSITNDKIYCHQCILFGKNIKKAWIGDEFSAWHRAIESMTMLEISEEHINAALKFKLRKTALPIIPLIREKQIQNKAYNCEVVNAFIGISLFLAQNCIAYRGHRENLFNISNQGNFIDLTKIISKYSSPLASYLESLENSSKKKPEVNFISKLRQNQLITSISIPIKTLIKQELNIAKFFSISMGS